MPYKWKTIERNIAIDEITESKYRVRVEHGRKPNGSARVVERLFDDLIAARVFRDSTKHDMGRNPALGLGMTMDDYFHYHYIDVYRRSTTARASQIAWVEERYNNQISPAKTESYGKPFGQRLIEDPPSIEAVQTAIAGNPKWSARTASAAIGVYRSIYNYLYDQGVVDRKPWDGHRFSYSRQTERPEGSDRRDAYKPAEAVGVCRALEAGSSPLTALAAVLFGAGLRVSEGVALDIADVHFGELDDIGLIARLHIYKSSSKRTESDLIAEYADQVKTVKADDDIRTVRAKVRTWAEENGIDLTVRQETKTSSSERWVTICEPFAGILKRAIADYPDEGPICRNADGTRRSAHNITSIWKASFNDGGPLGEFRFAQLRLARHTGDTMLRKARVAFSDLQMYRGHVSDLGVDAMNYFDPTDPEMFDYVAEKVFAWLQKTSLV